MHYYKVKGIPNLSEAWNTFPLIQQLEGKKRDHACLPLERRSTPSGTSCMECSSVSIYTTQ